MCFSQKFDYQHFWVINSEIKAASRLARFLRRSLNNLQYSTTPSATAHLALSVTSRSHHPRKYTDQQNTTADKKIKTKRARRRKTKFNVCSWGMGNQEQRKGDIARLEWDAQAEERHGAHALATRGSAPHNAELCVNLNAPNTGKMPPTKASNLYSTFPLNPTRLPVTSDMACQKLSFTAHGQHGGSKDQIQWSNPSRFFFPSEQQILNSRMTRQSRLKRLPEKEKLSRAADLKEKNQAVCACHGRGSGADSLTQKGLKSRETWSGLCKTISAVKREKTRSPGNVKRGTWVIEGEEDGLRSVLCIPTNQRGFFSLWKKKNKKTKEF